MIHGPPPYFKKKKIKQNDNICFFFCLLKKYSAPRVCMWMVIFLCLVRKTLLLKWIESKVQDFKMDKSIIKNQEMLYKYGKKHTLSLMNNFSKSRERGNVSRKLQIHNSFQICILSGEFLYNIYIYICNFIHLSIIPFFFTFASHRRWVPQILLLCIFTFFF